MKNIFIIFLLGIIGIGVSSCDEDCTDETNIDCPNYDPCWRETPVSAEFTIMQGLGYNEQRRYFEGDTFRTGFVRLQALQNLDSYEWHIGSDNRVFSEKTIELNYSPNTGWIDVMLIGKKKHKTGCLLDDGIDTIQKSFYLVPRDSILLKGKYRGISLSEPLDTFEFEFMYDFSTNPFSIGLSHFPNGCIRPYGIDCASTYREFIIPEREADLNCRIPSGWGELSLENTLTIIYEYDGDGNNNTTNVIKQDTFVGKKNR
jgi:hypothetical protein